MPKLHRHVPVALALILGLFSSSCLYTKRVILRHGKKVTATTAPKLLTATRDELNARIADLYKVINAFQATVDMTPSVGSVYTGEITEIKDVRAHILFRKPAEIRILGQLPVMRIPAFDMVSDGAQFKVSLPRQNLFEVGANTAPPISKNKLENLRPVTFLSSLLIRPADPTEMTGLVDATDEDNAFYVLYFGTMGSNGDFRFARGVWFDRIDLSIARQVVYDDSGAKTISDTRYSKWQLYNGVMFPAHIDINLPQDQYGVVLEILDPRDMQMNLPLTDDKFVLNQPEGSQLKVIGAPK